MRSAEFNRDDVLRNAMEAFRAKGYAKTTMQELVAATGLHPGSLYAAFGNKRGLLLAAVDHYVQEKSALRRSFFATASPLAGVQAYLEQVVNDALCGTCLVTRTLMELAEQDEELHLKLKAIYGELDADLAAVLSLALERGELAAGRDIPTLTAFLLINIQGLVTFAQCRPDPVLLGGVVTQLMTALRA
ncbi:TPA: TetR/AcrR family transcriptional regulator [Aeromonas hydrophila]|uniref:TetR/AcrR family transcriptional regulator n=1 Tax=Aeromonas hydrophila TaxID=644 RepID=UPI000FD184A0|nr:TetR/AcrR family transcriptional regulator [Aeromonas hydrophila]AZU47048.1 TetR family transcriptional regulator [Aeromonas hydrophila]MCV3293029.1 TetR/AcrR family transcriptional regulator [Aeromonas hydrophila]QBX72990.1 TetR/AcrR family transcriptional regulator [Aeromonas hydrophila]QBX77690.1 TetR/AcrR family transcriptional regulator [Aeromonas hydrophila]WDA23807.1 TetR/AcrR family transcriptional regulator [Aeromonas hydrophila]